MLNQGIFNSLPIFHGKLHDYQRKSVSQKTRFVISLSFPWQRNDALISYYEIFQIQTPGGASFQEGTVCTIATYNPEQAEVGGGAIGYSSRKETPNGDYVNATGT